MYIAQINIFMCIKCNIELNNRILHLNAQFQRCAEIFAIFVNTEFGFLDRCDLLLKH